MIPFREWENLPPDERAGKKQQCGPFCRQCYDRRRRPRTTWPLRELIEEAEFLFDGGADAVTIAQRLGVQHETLVRQYKRARDQGLIERQLNYRRTE